MTQFSIFKSIIKFHSSKGIIHSKSFREYLTIYTRHHLVIRETFFVRTVFVRKNEIYRLWWKKRSAHTNISEHKILFQRPPFCGDKLNYHITKNIETVDTMCRTIWKRVLGEHTFLFIMTSIFILLIYINI